MAKLKYRATIDFDKIKALGLPKGQGFAVQIVDPASRVRYAEELAKIKKVQEERGALVELDVTIELHYKKRSLDSNNLMWSLYTLEANWTNQSKLYTGAYGKIGIPDRIVTPKEIYEADMETYAPKYQMYLEESQVHAAVLMLEQAVGHVKRKVKTVKEGIWLVEIWETSSFWDSKKMSDHIKRQIDRMIDQGILKSDELDFDKIKQDFEQWRKENA